MDRLLNMIASLTADAGRPDPERRHAATRMLLDAAGCAFGAYGHEVPKTARRLAQRRAQPVGAHVFGLADQVSPDMAAFANGVMIRYLDLNDTYGSAVGIGHPSDYIPAVLAAADASGANGLMTLDAIALSYEVFCRLTDVTSLGVDNWDHVVNGAVASAVGAAYVQKFDELQIQHATALALVPNIALQVTRLGNVSMWKGCASANAARNGLFAAELAGEGITGPSMPFQGRGGLFSATGARADLDAWNRPHAAILDCHIKRFPAGYFSQSAIEAALSIRAQLSDTTGIDRVEVGTFAFGIHVMAGDAEKWKPDTRETADHSLPYVVAHALAHGRLDADSFTPAALQDEQTLRLLAGLTVTQDAACEAAWPAACANRVTVHLTNGTEITEQIGHYLGHATNPLSDAGVEGKFRELADPILGADRSAALAHAIWELHAAPTVGDIFEQARIADPVQS